MLIAFCVFLSLSLENGIFQINSQQWLRNRLELSQISCMQHSDVFCEKWNSAKDFHCTRNCLEKSKCSRQPFSLKNDILTWFSIHFDAHKRCASLEEEETEKQTTENKNKTDNLLENRYENYVF